MEQCFYYHLQPTILSKDCLEAWHIKIVDDPLNRDHPYFKEAYRQLINKRKKNNTVGTINTGPSLSIILPPDEDTETLCRCYIPVKKSILLFGGHSFFILSLDSFFFRLSELSLWFLLGVILFGFYFVFKLQINLTSGRYPH